MTRWFGYLPSPILRVSFPSRPVHTSFHTSWNSRYSPPSGTENNWIGLGSRQCTTCSPRQADAPHPRRSSSSSAFNNIWSPSFVFPLCYDAWLGCHSSITFSLHPECQHCYTLVPHLGRNFLELLPEVTYVSKWQVWNPDTCCTQTSSSWNSPPSVAYLLPSVALEQSIVILLDYNIKCISLLHYIFSLILCS